MRMLFFSFFFFPLFVWLLFAFDIHGLGDNKPAINFSETSNEERFDVHITMEDHMKIFDPLIGEVLKEPTVDKTYVEIFPLCNVTISLQALYICKTIIALRKPFYPKYDFRIGIIGCGNVGSLLLRTLTDLSGVKPSRVMVSTRRPETLQSFQREGIYVCNDNQKVWRVFWFTSFMTGLL